MQPVLFYFIFFFIISLIIVGGSVLINKLAERSKKKPNFKGKVYSTIGFIIFLYLIGSGMVLLYFWISTPNFDDKAYSELRNIPGISDAFVDGDEFGTTIWLTIKPGAETKFDNVCHLIWTKYRLTNFFDYRIGKNGSYNEYDCPENFHPDLN